MAPASLSQEVFPTPLSRVSGGWWQLTFCAFFSLFFPPSSRLHSNQLFCDCHLGWLSQWLRQRPTIGLFTQCAGPASLRGLNVAEIQKNEFSCSGEQHREGGKGNCTRGGDGHPYQPHTDLSEFPNCQKLAPVVPRFTQHITTGTQESVIKPSTTRKSLVPPAHTLSLLP